MSTRTIMRPAIAALVVLAGCGDGSRTPTEPGTSAPSPSPVPIGLRIEGPSLVTSGASAQYRAIASFADGRTEDVTSAASWFAPDNGVLVVAESGVVAASGVVTGGSPGEVVVTAYYPATMSGPDGVVIRPGTLEAQIRVLVHEPGTYRVSGVVTESSVPFPGIRVAVVAGKRAGLSVPTGHDGSYVMHGLAGATELAVSVEGFQTATRSIVITDDQTVDFSLRPLSGYDSLTGDWRLTLLASPSCRSEIPENAAARTVGARITQRGPQLSLDLTSPTRVILNDYPVSGHGGVSGATMSFTLQVDPERNPPRYVLLELLEPRRFLGIAAYGEGQRSGGTVTGWLSGEFSIFRSVGTDYISPGTVLEGRCYRKIGEDSSLHSFRLERQ